jgi:hypothetical protein
MEAEGRRLRCRLKSVNQFVVELSWWAKANDGTEARRSNALANGALAVAAWCRIAPCGDGERQSLVRPRVDSAAAPSP